LPRDHGITLALAQLIDLQKGGTFRLFFRRMLDARADGDDELAKTHALVDGRLEFRDPRGRLVEPLQHRDRFGPCRASGDHNRQQEQ